MSSNGRFTAAPPTYPVSRWRGPAIWLTFVFAVGLLLFFYHWLGPIAEGRDDPPLSYFVDEMTASFAAGVLFLGVMALVRRSPSGRGAWKTRLPLYLLAFVIFAALHTSAMWLLRELIYPLAGLGNYDYGRMPLRYFMEAPVQFVIFTIMVAGTHLVLRLQEAREQELRNAQLESSLVRAQLQNLRLQLQPHFLFNTLNTISSTMYEDPEAADEMIDGLAELLRASLRTAQTDEVSLETELESMDLYFGIMKARFGDRLTIHRSIDPDASNGLVPSLILQPLVENAIRHGNCEREGRGAITIDASRRDARLVLVVHDDGGPRETIPSSGIGLGSTRDRLELLYGEDQRLEIENRGAGFGVRIDIPYHTEKR